MLPSATHPSTEADSLRQRVALEQARVGELEGLLALARADQVGTAGGSFPSLSKLVHVPYRGRAAVLCCWLTHAA